MPAFRLRPNVRSGHSETTLVRTAIDSFQERPGSRRECAYRRIVPNLAYGSIHDGNDGAINPALDCRVDDFLPFLLSVAGKRGLYDQHAEITGCPSF